MADQNVNISHIDRNVVAQVDWAREATLAKLLRQAELTRDNSDGQLVLLEQIAKVKIADLRKINRQADQAAEALDSAADGARRAASANERFAAHTRESGLDVRRSVNDLRYSLGFIGRSFRNIIDDTTNPLRQLPGAMEASTNAFSRQLGRAGPIFAVLGTAVAAITDRFMQGAESYRTMMQSGIMFNGSVVQMISSVRSAGVSIELAGRIIEEYGQALMAGGEQRFFRTIERSAELFARLGMNQEEGMRAFAELEEMRRQSGLAYLISEDDRIRANGELLTLMQSQSVLTGISVRQQREAARRAQASERVRVLQAGLTPQQLAAQERSITQLTSLGLSTELIEATLMEAMTGAATQQSALARQSIGPEYERMLASIRAGRPEDIGGVAQREAIARSTTQFAQQYGPALALGRGGATDILRTQVVGAREVALAATRAAPDAEADLRRRQDMAQRILEGQRVLDQATQGYFTTVNQTAVAMGRVEGMVMRLADNVLGPLMSSLGNLTTAINNTVGATGGRTGQGLGGSLMDLASNPLVLGGLGLGGVLLARRAAGGLFGARALAGGPPAPPSLPGATVGTAAGGGLFSRLLGGAVGGASTGLMAGPWGALLGAGLGIGGTLLGQAMMGGGENTPPAPAAAPTMTPAFSAGFDRLNTSLETLLGPNGAMATRLDQLISINEDTRALTRRILANQ
jgi:hypothetical protein